MKQLNTPEKFLEKLKPYFKSLGLVALVTLAGELIHRRFEPTNLVMLYLLTVVISASFWGRGPATFTSLIGVLIFDFVFIPPRFTLSVDDAQYILTFAGLFIVGIVISELTNATRQRAIESNQRQTQLELLKAKEKLQVAILNSLSHDLRTPLTSVTGALSSLLNDTLNNSRQTELITTAFEEASRLNRFVENLLDMAKIEAGALHTIEASCEIRDVIGVALEHFKGELEKRDVRITIPTDLPDIKMDFVLMVKVITNIVDNALKYSHENSRLDISAENQVDYVLISIKDEGIGIPENELTCVFNKFYRTKKTETIQGTGLGLSICKGIVETHKGKIWLDNNKQRGITVFVKLPFSGSNH
ncbi:MAG: DUF4118 domain-containing protein [Candidatus Omnitrophica bacterium]|nr:DUF4118 domain-containing protein [Candidatus Omnitrophota bacterium]